MDSHAIVIADAEGVIRVWSPGAETAFGYPAAEAVGRTLDLIVPPDFRDDHWRGFRRAMTAGEAAVENQAVPFPARRADGQVVETPGRVVLVRTPQGQAIGAMVVFG